MVAAGAARPVPQGSVALSGVGGGLGGVAPNTLSARLKSLGEPGRDRARGSTRSHPPRYEYFLTDKGKALGPVLKALYSWGERYG